MMLGFGYNKNTVKDGLKRSTRAVLIGGLFHHEHASSFGLNEEGSAWLYTEMQAQLIFCIGIAFEVKICGKKSWATPQFMQDCIKEEILDYEKRESMSPGSILSYIFRRLYEIETMTPQERRDLIHLRQSAELIQEKDRRADIAALTKLFESKTREFVSILLERF